MSSSALSLVNPQLSREWIIANARGRGVKVAVIDSGIDAAHPDLTGKVRRAAVIDEPSEKHFVCREIAVAECSDAFGHGTGVAGIIASLAPEVELISVRILDAYNRASGEALLTALEWTLQQNVDVVNLSLTTSRKAIIQPLFELCEQAYRQETLLVSSKRNFGDIGCPAMFSSVISIDNDTQFEQPWQLRYLPQNVIEFAARGMNVSTSAPGGGYQLQTGTSFACPHVSGICALLRELYPRANSWEIKTILKSLCITS